MAKLVKGVRVVDEQRVLMYTLFPAVAFLEAIVEVGYASAAVLTVMLHDYMEVEKELEVQQESSEGC